MSEPPLEQDQPTVWPGKIIARKKRTRRLLVAVGLLVLAGLVYYPAFCNWSLHSDEWTEARLGQAISDGLGYLAEQGTFGRSVRHGGEISPHHFFLEHVLRQHPHAGLSWQLQRGREVNAQDWEWRAFFGMPGWPRDQLTETDRTYIQMAMAMTNRAADVYSAWLIYSLYPDWTTLPAEDHRRLLEDTSELKTTYELTHALLAYLWMGEVSAAAARQHQVDRLIDQVNRRLYRIQEWDPCTGDLYNERVAFWLYMENGPRVKPRWIERILLSQNKDGGWTYRKSVDRTIGQFLGFDSGDHQSHPHPTFLALFALSEYARRMGRHSAHESLN